jgi:hypothetical protein
LFPEYDPSNTHTHTHTHTHAHTRPVAFVDSLAKEITQTLDCSSE